MSFEPGGTKILTGGSSVTAVQPLELGWRRALRIVTSQHMAWLVIGFGAALRAVQYLSNSALYVDEGALTLNIINRTFPELLQPLDFNQAAPPGFLVLEKLAVSAFGDTEYTLRLFPFLFSIVALFLFYAIARRVLVAWAVPVALLFFAVSEQVIYFAAQVKQYSSDIALTLLIVLVGLRIESKDLTTGRVTFFALAGAVVVWLSHPSVFVLAGVGITLALIALKRREWRRVWKLTACCALWVLSFAAFYTVSLSHLTANQKLETSWMNKGTFMPLPPTSLSDVKWFLRAYFTMFSNPGDLPFPIVAGAVFIIGCFALLKKRKTHLLMLISPILFTLLISGLHKYPFGRRLLLFAIPLILVVIVAGAEFVIQRATPYGALLGTIILAFLLLQPVGGATNSMVHPPVREDVRPILSYIKGRWQPGDKVYVYYHQREAFLYYAPKYGFNPDEYMLGLDNREYWRNHENEAYMKDLDQLRGQNRAWLLFAYVRTIEGVNEENYIVQHLDRVGKRIDETRRAGASAYLYDLSS